jgi:uncharacterized protein DUF1330
MRGRRAKAGYSSLCHTRMARAIFAVWIHRGRGLNDQPVALELEIAHLVHHPSFYPRHIGAWSSVYYAPRAKAANKAAGGKFRAARGRTIPIEGEPPKSRVVIQPWDSLEKIQAYHNSTAFK